jgi:DNA polymerase-3 subunit delta'
MKQDIKNTTDNKPPRLPLPAPALEHHAKTLFGPMREWRSQRRMPPVLLLSGQPGVGKRSIAFFLSQWVLCEKSGFQSEYRADPANGDARHQESAAPDSDPVPCGECTSCKKALHGSWIDFTEIEAEDDTFRIDQFRKLKATQGFGAHEGAYRIILIADADRMTTQAANSVLKLLEETPKGWIFLLTATDPTLLLPTLVSRCQTLRLKPFSKEALHALLAESGIEDGKLQVCVELAQGSWGRAFAWAQSEAWERRKMVVDFLHDPKAFLNSLVEMAAQDPKNMDQMLDQIESLMAELIQWSLREEAPADYRWLNADASNVLTERAKQASKAGLAPSRDRWIACVERIARARIELQAPINRKLLAQDVLLPFLAQ